MSGFDTVSVCTLAGADPMVKKLAKALISEARGEILKIGAYLDFAFEPVVQTFDDLPAQLDHQPSILQIVSHADQEGVVDVDDVWGALQLTPERLARTLDGQNVQLALVITCFGDKIAETLIERGVVDVAVGIDLPFTLAGARAFSRSFYRAVAEGRTVEEAVEAGRRHAAGRLGDETDRICLRGSDDARRKRLFEPPAVCLFGAVDKKHTGAIEALRKGLSPYRTWHVSDAQFGSSEYDRMHATLLMAKVQILLFDGQLVDDPTVLDGVVRAIMQVRQRKARLVPLYLEGTSPHPHLPFGVMRLKPAYLENHESAEALGREFAEKLVAPVVGPRPSRG